LGIDQDDKWRMTIVRGKSPAFRPTLPPVIPIAANSLCRAVHHHGEADRLLLDMIHSAVDGVLCRRPLGIRPNGCRADVVGRITADAIVSAPLVIGCRETPATAVLPD